MKKLNKQKKTRKKIKVKIHGKRQNKIIIYQTIIIKTIKSIENQNIKVITIIIIPTIIQIIPPIIILTTKSIINILKIINHTIVKKIISKEK